MSNRKIFKNEGLLRDQNFADVPNKRQGLTNLVNDLVSGEGLQFSAADLDAIQNISTTIVTNDDLTALSNIAVDRSQVNEEGNIVIRQAEPFVTIKNQIDSIIVNTDDPPFFSGGDGLDAEFWNEDDISSSLGKSSTGDDIFVGTPDTQKDTFWDNGFFEFTGNIDDTLAGSNGGIQWNGFYIPNATGTTTFRFDTSGFFMLELEDAQGNLEVVKNIYAEQIDVTAQTAVSNGTTVEVSASDARHIAEEAAVNPATLQGVTVNEVSYDADNDVFVVEFSAPVTLGQGETFTVDISSLLGFAAYSVEYDFRNLVEYQPRRIRISLWYPGSEPYLYKVLDCNFDPPNRSAGNLPFWYLYSEVSEETGEGFKNFFDNRLLADGGTIGPEQANSSTEYNQVASISPLQVEYEPPKSLPEITRAVYIYGKEAESEVLETTSNSPFTTRLEVGNRVVSAGVPRNSRIISVSSNNVVVIDQEATEAGNETMRFIDHRGLVGIFNADSSGSTVTLNSGDTGDLKPGMVVVTDTSSDYIRIDSVIDNLNFDTDTDLNVAGDEIFVYYDRGLDNKSLDNFCVGVLGKEVSGNFSAGSTTITLNNTIDLETGMVIQATDFIAQGTTLEAINGNDITLSNVTLAELTDGITVVFAPAGTTLNKEQCVIPLNTAPPFVGTDTGLATDKDVDISNGTLNVISLNAGNVSVQPVGLEPPTDISFVIGIQGSSFKILGSTT